VRDCENRPSLKRVRFMVMIRVRVSIMVRASITSGNERFHSFVDGIQ